MKTASAIQRRYATVIAIETVPSADLEKYADIVERLSCGHLGANHGGTWEGTEAPLRRRPEQYSPLIGRTRLCRDCSSLISSREGKKEHYGRQL